MENLFQNWCFFIFLCLFVFGRFADGESTVISFSDTKAEDTAAPNPNPLITTGLAVTSANLTATTEVSTLNSINSTSLSTNSTSATTINSTSLTTNSTSRAVGNTTTTSNLTTQIVGNTTTFINSSTGTSTRRTTVRTTTYRPSSSGPGWWLFVALLITIILVIIAGIIFYRRDKSPYRTSNVYSQIPRQSNFKFINNWRAHEDDQDNIIQLEPTGSYDNRWSPRITFP